ANVEDLLKLKCNGSDVTVESALQEKILTIGENIKIRRFERLEGDLITYTHGDGRISVMVKFDTDVAKKDAFDEYAKDVAMQIAAVAPQYLEESEIPAEVVTKEKEILTVQAMNEGKPAAIAEKMVVGRIKKFFKEICLVDQAFVKDNEKTIAQYTESVAKELSGSIKIVKFVRFEKGEGIEKRVDNFADEVASMAK
ncbi:MAG: translation elongation factor Ts, partial [Oscillospiraceae bacterium]